MARSHPGLEDFLDFMSTPAWRSAMLSGAVAFALLHAVALCTPPFDLNASADEMNVPQLLHIVAVLLRFAVPFGCLTSALNQFLERRKSASTEGSASAQVQ